MAGPWMASAAGADGSGCAGGAAMTTRNTLQAARAMRVQRKACRESRRMAVSVSEGDGGDGTVEEFVHLGAGLGEAGDGGVGAAIDVAEAVAGDEDAVAEGDGDVVGEEGAPLGADAEIEAEVLVDAVGDEGGLERLGGGEVDLIGAKEDAELGGDVDVDADAKKEQAGVHEVGLVLVFVGAEIGQEAEALLEADGGAGEVEALAHEVAEGAAGEVDVVHDGVEAGGAAVAGVAVAG